MTDWACVYPVKSNYIRHVIFQQTCTHTHTRLRHITITSKKLISQFRCVARFKLTGLSFLGRRAGMVNNVLFLKASISLHISLQEDIRQQSGLRLFASAASNAVAAPLAAHVSNPSPHVSCTLSGDATQCLVLTGASISE